MRLITISKAVKLCAFYNLKADVMIGHSGQSLTQSGWQSEILVHP